MKIKVWLTFVLIMLTMTACGELHVEIIPENSGQALDQSSDTTQIPGPDPQLDAQKEATAKPENTPPNLADPFPALAYVGMDGNIWLREAGGQSHRQITTDAHEQNGENMYISYSAPELSSDGAWLAYSREEGVFAGEGLDFTRTNWAFKLETGEQRLFHEGYTNGIAWKPGTHLLAYGVGVNQEYFLQRGESGENLATGIMAINLDSGETSELVAPARGYTLANPNWSANGRFLSFAESFAMEGSGYFAFYDFDAQEYVAWEEALGNISWSPDGSSLTYSRVTYTPTGEERLYIHNREGDEMLVGPDYDGPAYADNPKFSPRGDQIAYLANSGEPESWTYVVTVLNVAIGEVWELGEYEDVWDLAWTPDGRYLVFSYGHWESRQIIAIEVETGEQTLLAEGRTPSVAGQ